MADAPTTTPDKKVVKHDDHVEPPVFGGDGASTSTSLSQQATQPGDQGALNSVKGKSDAPANLPSMEVGGDQTAKPVPQLDHDTLLKTAQELHDAIKKTSWFGLKSSPDNDQIMRLLAPLSAADRAALENIYHDQFDKNGAPDSLRRDLKDKLGEYDFRVAEAVLNRADNRTNDAGALMVALTHCKDDKDRGNAEVRAVLQTLNTQQLAQLDADFKKAYGQSYTDALNSCKDLTQATKDALPLLEKGVDKRTADDIVKMAHVAVDNGDPRLFAESIKGDSPEAQAARKTIMADENFKNQIADKFPSAKAQDMKDDGRDPKTLPFEQRVDQVALDYLQEGRISLATVTSENTGKWIFDNKENIELAARNASDKERQDFTAGRDLALSNKAPANDTEKAQLDFYNKIHDAFKKGGNDREVSIWEDQLMHGRETIVSEMAKGHSDGWGPFHFGSGTNMNDVMTKVENLSKDDWTLLKGPDGAKFRQQISDSLGTYADQGEKDRVMKMLDAKIAAPTYEDAAKIHRNLEDTIKDNKGHSFLCFGTSYDGKNILAKVANMSPEDAANYKNDPTFKKDIDKFINDNLNDDEKLYAQRLLKQVEASGQPPKPDAVDTIIGDKVNGAKPETTLKDAETALQDPALRERLSKPDSQLSDDDKKIKQIIENAVAEAAMKHLGYPPDSYDDSMFQKYSKPLFETGHIPDDLKLDLGFPKTDLLPAIAAAPQAERDAAMKKLDANEQQVVQAIMSNKDGKPDLADRMRIFTTGAGGDASDFKDELSKLSFADRQALKDEYAKKYKSDLDNDFLGKLKGSEQDEYKALLTAGTSDGRQQYYDNYHQMLRSESGFSPDGSQLTMERANDLYANSLEEYQKVYKTLPPEKQQALDKYFGDSLEQYKASKEKLAEILVDATITAAALAATPFTGGASLAAVVAIAAASGAAFRVGAMAAIEGNDMDWSAKNVVKQLVIGGASAALNFVGAEAFAGAGQLAKGVAETAVTDAAVIGGKEILTQSGKEILAKELPDLIKAGGQQLSEKELGALVEKAAPLASDAEKAALKNAIEESVAKNYSVQQAKIAEEVANRTKLQAAKYLGKEVVQSSVTGGAANAVSDLVAAPFNENGIDWKQLGMSTLTGFAIGAVIPIGFHGVKAGKDFVVNMTKTSEQVTVMENGVARTVTRDAAVIDPDQNVRTVIKHADGSPDTVLEPGKGEPPYKPKDGDTIVEGKETAPETRPKEVPSTTPEAAEITRPPSTQALKQTNEFATSHQIDGPLEDGFIYGGANRQFDKFGKPNFGSDPAFVVNKQELAPIIEDAKAKFGNLPPEERAAALAKYVHEKFNPPGMSQQDINTWYLDFLDKHPGQTVSLNDFIKAGKGVCTQESVLYKVLGDELGLHPSLVRGNGLNGGDDINHVWTTIDLHDGKGPRVYDPRQDIAGTPVDEVPSHKPGAQIVAEGKGQVELNMKPGVDKFDYDGVDGWVVDKYNADGSVDIRRPGSETVDKSKLQDFQALNGDQLARDGGLKVGERYSVRKSDGTIDSNWRLDGIAPDGSLRLSNERAWHQEGIPREAIVGRAPELFGTPGEAATAIKNSKNMDEFYDNAVEALGEHQTDPAVLDAVKSRLGQEINTPDIFKNPDRLSQLRDIANEYGLGADLDSQLGSRLGAEFKNNPNLLKNADQVKEIKQIIQGMQPPNAEMAQEIKARLTKEISSPDLLKDPIKAAEIADLAKASGISKDLSAEFSKRLSDELKSNKTLFTDKTQLENLKTIVASMKESGAQFDDKFQNAFFDRVRVELANKNKGAVADMHAMADQIGTVKTKNAVRYFEINRVAFDGTIEKPLTDAQLQGLGSAQKFRDSISGKVRPADLNDDLKEVGAYIDPDAMGKSHMHSANIYDKATGKPMMDYSPRGLKDGKPYKIIGVSIDGGIDQNYQRRVWDSVIAQYLAGLR